MRLTMAFALPPLKKGDRGGFVFCAIGKSPLPPFAKGGKLFVDKLLEHQRELAKEQTLWLYRRTCCDIDRTHMNICILKPERFV